MPKNSKNTDSAASDDAKTDGSTAKNSKTADSAESDSDKSDENTAKNSKTTDSAASNTEKASDTSSSNDNKSAKEETVEGAVKKTITIKSGDSSYVVAKKLKEAGIVENAEDFDDYLCKNKYDKRIATGTYSVNSGMSYQALAQKFVNGQ